MHIDLVESLRCVREHEPTWLVAVAERVEARDILSGVLGCPDCRAEYPVVQGVAYFAAPADPPRAGAADAGLAGGAGDGTDTALRAAALLDLVEPGGFVVLAGTWGAAAPELLALASVHVLALNAPRGLPSGGGLSVAVAPDDVPVRAGTARGVALDAANASPRQLAGAAAALRTGGRLVAPAQAPIPEGVSLLARDERHWVAERPPAAGSVVRLALGRSRDG